MADNWDRDNVSKGGEKWQQLLPTRDPKSYPSMRKAERDMNFGY